jgi:drug/metabolite transporter (DMT)-like permease
VGKRASEIELTKEERELRKLIHTNLVWPVLFVIMTCFAANSVMTRYLVLVSDVSPFLLTVVRFVSGLATLLMLTVIRPTTFRHNKPDSSYFLGALFLGAYAFSISYGYLFIPVAAGTFIFYTFVVVTMAAHSVIQGKEKLTIRSVLGQLFGLFGVLVITFSKIGSVTTLGVLLMAVTGTSWGLYSAYGKRFENAFSYTYNSFLILGAIAVIASIMVVLLGQPIFANFSVKDLGLALYMGMVSTALSYVLWNVTVKRIAASVGGLVQLVVPVLAPILGIILLGEQVTPALMLGGGFVLVGIYLAQSTP